jgi:hypothetical protein
MHRADLDHPKHTAIASCSSVNTNIMSLLVLVRVVLSPFVDMVLDVVDRENRLIFLVEYLAYACSFRGNYGCSLLMCL